MKIMTERKWHELICKERMDARDAVYREEQLDRLTARVYELEERVRILEGVGTPTPVNCAPMKSMV